MAKLLYFLGGYAILSLSRLNLRIAGNLSL